MEIIKTDTKSTSLGDYQNMYKSIEFESCYKIDYLLAQ